MSVSKITKRGEVRAVDYGAAGKSDDGLSLKTVLGLQ